MIRLVRFLDFAFSMVALLFAGQTLARLAHALLDNQPFWTIAYLLFSTLFFLALVGIIEGKTRG